MRIEYTADHSRIDWKALRRELIDDDFHNGRTAGQLQRSFENSQVAVYAMMGTRCVGTARALSDGVWNAYVVDVWTLSECRDQGVGSEMMKRIIAACPGQHIYLFTDDAVPFYRRLGFTPRPLGLELVSGEWLQNASLDDPH
ncbi:MAG: GNAT family N-acetyltransferase [Pseudomonadales bacterium]|nr:GNAT family N-acetyltransferase [Pseudomonadales bacterium]